MSLAQAQFNGQINGQSNWKQTFWDEKILTWEYRRYDRAGTFGKGGAVAARLNEACRLLAPAVRGKTVLELGCGSGRLAETLLAAGASGYVGWDLSPRAIAVARERLHASGLASRATLFTGSALYLDETKADLCVSLGFLDWLQPNEITDLFSRLESPLHLHSFSELRAGSIEQWLHRLYVFLSYGRKTGQYRPRYLGEKFVQELFRMGTPRPIHFVRNRRMKFGVLAHNLDA